jgi:hypothetical protein
VSTTDLIGLGVAAGVDEDCDDDAEVWTDSNAAIQPLRASARTALLVNVSPLAGLEGPPYTAPLTGAFEGVSIVTLAVVYFAQEEVALRIGGDPVDMEELPGVMAGMATD